MNSKTNLVIVESPAKAATIESYLGSDYKVTASFGHVRDLPKSKLGVDVDHNFEPEYIIPKKAQKSVTALKQLAKKATVIWLATDLDREGEAIAWHIANVLTDVNKDAVVKRITFNEITKPAILEAIEKPRELNINLVDAQQGRRVLDRLVGYTLSPLLWKKLYKGLSAGRVQSVALRFIVDRERERDAFKPVEYWSLEAALKKGSNSFSAQYQGQAGAKATDPLLPNKQTAAKVIEAVTKAKWKIKSVEESDQQRRPRPPLTTSTLQQAAAGVLGYSAKRTMMAAQKLYEAGFITYMRTDSVQLATSAVREIRAVVQKEYGDEFVPDQAPYYASKKSAQEAHEAIRPTHVRTLPETVAGKVSKDEASLYEMIWRRTVATQMKPAQLKITAVVIEANKHLFKANGLRVLFEGYLKALGKQAGETILPKLATGDAVDLVKLNDLQHFTEPPPRFTEASLIKQLEESGVGRPSTYAPTVSTLYARGYIERDGKALVPQEVGKQVIDLLSEHFPKIVDVDFTAHMEEDLDSVAEGKKKWQKVIGDFYQPFAKTVLKKTDEIVKVNTDEEIDEQCPLCTKPLIIKTGRFGRFKACTGFPDCKFTQNVVTEVGVSCPSCGKPLTAKKTRTRKTFFGCSGYPACTFALWGLTEKDLAKKVAEFVKEGKELPHLAQTKTDLQQKATKKG
ncbi:MAG: type I DNA topoisomerase [bacterium]|nr:type I DNA topoisomerase [bacterium]